RGEGRPVNAVAVSYAVFSGLFPQIEDKDGVPRGNCNELPAVERERNRRASDLRAEIHFPELLPGIGVEGAEELTIPSKNHATFRGKHAADGPDEILAALGERCLPAYFSRPGINGLDI